MLIAEFMKIVAALMGIGVVIYIAGAMTDRSDDKRPGLVARVGVVFMAIGIMGVLVPALIVTFFTYWS